MAAGAVGASSVPDEEDTIEDTLVCLLEVLGRRNIDPERPGRFGGGGGCMLARAGPVFCAMIGLAGSFLSINPFASRILPSPVGEGNCVSLKSVEADSILVCRSSKLTEGRKS